MNHRLGVVLPEPLAYFLTWPTYGTWLPGDDRGWVKRHHGHQLPSPWLELEAVARMTEDACRLDRRQRRLVEQTVADHCRIRGWALHAVNCRSNHLHVVVTADRHPNEVCEQFKAWTVRKLKELERSPGTPSRAQLRIREKWWAERGSKRFLNDADSLEAAILYVRDAQSAGGSTD
jgi:REP element-mobilizing transposase RayT